MTWAFICIISKFKESLETRVTCTLLSEMKGLKKENKELKEQMVSLEAALEKKDNLFPI